MKMKKIIQILLLMIVSAMVVVACSDEAYKPVAINEDTDRCVICNMAIKDDQFATQIITTEGQALKFDDLGCLHTWQEQNGTATVGATYVRDYNSMQWIKYEKAYYVYDTSIQTPMAYGIISFEDQSSAEQYIAEHSVGTIMTATDLQTHSWEVNHTMMQSHGADHDHGASDNHEADHTHEAEQDHEATDHEAAASH